MRDSTALLMETVVTTTHAGDRPGVTIKGTYSIDPPLRTSGWDGEADLTTVEVEQHDDGTPMLRGAGWHLNAKGSRDGRQHRSQWLRSDRMAPDNLRAAWLLILSLPHVPSDWSEFDPDDVIA